MEGIALIDVAVEDDLLFPCPVEVRAQSPGLFESHNECLNDTNHVYGDQDLIAYNLRITRQSDSPERKRRVPDMYNLRKSLAWDSAFFTSEGVLDPEELDKLNSINSKMEQHHLLPPTQEDFLKSSDFLTIVSSEDLTLESLAIDPFENHRISTQKSPDKCSEPYSIDAKGHSRISTPWTANSKTPVASRKCMISRQGKPGIPKDITHAQMAITENREHKLSSRPPRSTSGTPGTPNRRVTAPNLVQVKNIAGRALSVSADPSTGFLNKSSPAKKASSHSSTSAKMPEMVSPMQSDSWSSSSDQINYCKSLPAKKFVGGQSTGVLPRYSPAKKSSFCSSTPTKMLQMTSPKLCSSWSSSSDRASKLSLDNLKKRSTTRSINKSSSSLDDRSTIRVPKGKNLSRNGSSSTATPKSIFGFSSSGSPSRSIDSIGSASSSSTTSTGRKHVASVTIDHSPSLHLSTSSKALSGARVKISTEIDKHGSYSRSKGQEFKPSGLRLPTPKIGYFDVDKTTFQNSPRCTQRVLQSDVCQNNSTGKGEFSVVKKVESSKDQTSTSTKLDSKLTRFPVSSPSKAAENVQMPSPSLYSEAVNNKSSTENYHGMSFGSFKEIPPITCRKIDSGISTVEVAEVRLDQVSKADVKCSNHGGVLHKSSDTDNIESISGLRAGKSLTMFKSNDKENSCAFSAKNCSTSREVKAGAEGTATIEQLEKRLSSLKLSLSKASSENAGDLTAFLEKGYLIPEQLLSAQRLTNFGSPSRMPLSENNYEINGTISSSM